MDANKWYQRLILEWNLIWLVTKPCVIFPMPQTYNILQREWYPLWHQTRGWSSEDFGFYKLWWFTNIRAKFSGVLLSWKGQNPFHRSVKDIVQCNFVLFSVPLKWAQIYGWVIPFITNIWRSQNTLGNSPGTQNVWQIPRNNQHWMFKPPPCVPSAQHRGTIFSLCLIWGLILSNEAG